MEDVTSFTDGDLNISKMCEMVFENRVTSQETPKENETGTESKQLQEVLM